MLDLAALRAASLEFAQACLWDTRPVDVKVIQEFADQVYDEAMSHREFIEGQERDPNLLTYCVRYLATTHAIPPMRSNIEFVRAALSVLVELACPNCGASIEDLGFYKELDLGLAQAKKELEA